MDTTANPILTERFEDAFGFAAGLHRRQLRKGTSIPYVSHLLQVAGLVLEYGGDEDQAIAALLHDAIEHQATDAGGVKILSETIGRRFGAEVRRLVESCTDSVTTHQLPWRARKEAYVRNLAQADLRAALVSFCDKLHNARHILSDLRASRTHTDMFVPGTQQLWYLRSVTKTLRDLGLPRIEDLIEVVAAIEAHAQQHSDSNGHHPPAPERPSETTVRGFAAR